MKALPSANAKDIVLIGGGHSHIEVLKKFGMDRPGEVNLTLISRDYHAAYSGMIPGLVAGHYTFDECHINLRPLARFADCRVYHDEAVGVDLEKKLVLCKNRPPVHFDLLSINVGSTPTAHVSGVKDYALPAKPVDRFLEGWASLRERALGARGEYRVLVVGGGAGGVELVLAMQHNLNEAIRSRKGSGSAVRWHLAMDTPDILVTHNGGVRSRMKKVLSDRRVSLHPGFRIARVEAAEVVSEEGKVIPYDALVWVTNAAAAPWFRESGFATDDEGFILVNEYLQSTSHPSVFAGGDAATMESSPRPKSGVFAVRQGPYLNENLRRALRGEALERFAPQRRFLSLVSTGDRNAIASRGRLVVSGRPIWRWKDRIDRRFMEKYSELPSMNGVADGAGSGTMTMHCGGCGSKVGGATLSSALERIEAEVNGDVVVGLGSPDDAAVVSPPAGALAVHTVDFFPSFIDDPYVFGKITANHCLSDCYAMGASVHNVLAMVTLPYGGESAQEQTLHDLLRGALEVIKEDGAVLVGGHTTEGPQLSFGLTVNGYVQPGAILRKGGMKAGDALILTKALGVGVILAADMRGDAPGRWVEGASEAMLQSNREAARCLVGHGATACTDVTGFGLAGHLLEMLRASAAGAELKLETIPVLAGALEGAKNGIESSLYPQNSRAGLSIDSSEELRASPVYPLLFDPQTSGGLLASVPEGRAAGCIEALTEKGYAAAVIGTVSEATDGKPIRLRN